MFQYILTFIISILSGALIALLTRLFKRRLLMIVLTIIIIGSIPAIYALVKMQPRLQKAQIVFSDFNQCFPVNNYGVHWGVFNDNPYNGNSGLTIKVRPNRKNINDCYGELSFYLGEECTIKPYCGVSLWI